MRYMNKFQSFLTVPLIALFALIGQAQQASGDRPVEAKMKAMAEQMDSAFPDAAKIGQRAVEEAVAKGFYEKALKSGTIPSFTLPDAFGKPVSSKNLLAKGPLVLVFYRGAWCPFCNLYLHGLQEYLPQIKAKGARVVAISGEKPDASLAYLNSEKLDMTILSDTKLKVTRKFGLVYDVPDYLNAYYMKIGKDIKKEYDLDKPELAGSAAYVVNRQGKIVYSFVEASYKRGAEPSELLEALSKVN